LAGIARRLSRPELLHGQAEAAAEEAATALVELT
jgi:hypothetical protein